MEKIEIRGARVHNLKSVDLDLPLHQLICFAGPSGSGKTSLAFHTLLTESKRRLVNSFPNSLKFFSDRPAPVDVDRIYPVLPVFGLPQINPVLGSRSVVSDMMRLTDDLQNLFFKSSIELCPEHHIPLKKVPVSHEILKLKQGQIGYLFLKKERYPLIMGEMIPSRSFHSLEKKLKTFDENDDYYEVLRFKFEKIAEIDKKIEELKIDLNKEDLYLLVDKEDELTRLRSSQLPKCPKCDFVSKPTYSVSAFSPYSALGACSSCQGYGANLIYSDDKIYRKDKSIDEGGLKLLEYSPFQDAFHELVKILKKKKIPFDVPIKKLGKSFFDLVEMGEGRYPGYTALMSYLDSKKYKPSVRVYIRNLQQESPCSVCETTRLNSQIHHYRIEISKKYISLPEIMKMTIQELTDFFDRVELRSKIENQLLGEIREKLKYASSLGLGHLKLLRKAKTLSAGEYQRLLIIKYLSFKGTDSLFVLDEPTLGLSEIEMDKMLQGLRDIISQGNTVIVIDHSEFVQKSADHLVVMGPGSGDLGGQVLYEGKPASYFKTNQKTKWHKVSAPKIQKFIELQQPQLYSQVFPDVKIPTNALTWVHGPSGVGKSAVIVKILANELYKRIYDETLVDDKYQFSSLKNPEKFEDVIVISSELNRFTSRSSVGTVTELAGSIRRHFLKLPVSKSMDLKDGHLSSNSDLGMCPKCEGRGSITIEMQYLEDIVLTCEDCRGKKLKPLYADLTDGKMTVSEAYQQPLNQVLSRIELTPKFRRVWDYLKILNLDYLSLDRNLNSLSGGEKQRIFLLSKLLTQVQHSLLVFENISFGLSTEDLKRLGEFLEGLILLNNTIIIIDSSPHLKNLAHMELIFDTKKTHLKPII